MLDQDRERIESSIQEAKEKGLFRHVDLRNQIKLKADTPKLVLAIPMGDKDDPDLFVCPKCSRRHFGTVRCEGCGEDHSAVRKARHAGLVPIEWLLNAWQIVPPLLCSMQVMVRKSVLSAQARNEMTYEAIKTGAKYIFYWDDDTVIPPKAIYDLHNMMERNPDTGILTGVYTTREECPEPLVYKNHGEGSYWNFTCEPGVLEPVFAAGAGCMMARVEALIEVERILGGAWWEDHQDIEGLEAGRGKVMWGHDIRFCKRMWEAAETFGKPGGASRPWNVQMAGWIQCLHFDIQRQTMYGLPKDAPCFKNKNTSAYWNHLWEIEGHGTGRLYPALYDRIVEMVPEESKVVDFGCGIGILLDRLVKQKRVHGFGYDISERAIDMLRSRWLQGEVADAASFQMNHFPPEETVLVSTETIEHLDDVRLDAFLKEASKAKQSILSTPDGELPGTPPGEHVQVFTEESLKDKLNQYWERVEIEKIPRGPVGNQNILVAVCGGRRDEQPSGSSVDSNHHDHAPTVDNRG